VHDACTARSGPKSVQPSRLRIKFDLAIVRVSVGVEYFKEFEKQIHIPGIFISDHGQYQVLTWIPFTKSDALLCSVLFLL